MSVEVNFDAWLIKKLESLEIDDEILGSYISSVVTSDDPDPEKKATLKDILSGLTQQNVDIESICSEVLEKWSENLLKPEEPKSQNDVAFKVAMIMEKQAQPVFKVVNRSSEEEKLRAAILSSNALVDSEDEEGDFEKEDSSYPTQNQNVDNVLQAEKEKREKLKAEAEMKKAQDKAALEKQRQKQEEKKKKGTRADSEKKGKAMKKGCRR